MPQIQKPASFPQRATAIPTGFALTEAVQPAPVEFNPMDEIARLLGDLGEVQGESPSALVTEEPRGAEQLAVAPRAARTEASEAIPKGAEALAWDEIVAELGSTSASRPISARASLRQRKTRRKNLSRCLSSRNRQTRPQSIP